MFSYLLEFTNDVRIIENAMIEKWKYHMDFLKLSIIIFWI